MLIKNISKRKFMHAVIDEEGEQKIISIEPDETKEIDDFVAEIWLKIGDVVKVDDGSKDKEIERLKAENEKLKEKANKPTRSQLMARCKELGIETEKKDTVATLIEKLKPYDDQN